MIKKIVNSIKEYGIKGTIFRIRRKLMGEKKYDVLKFIPQSNIKKENNCKFKKKIKFSIITPLYNTPKEFLIEMIESCILQTYSNWELCLADGSDDNGAYVQKIVEEYRQKDKRIKYKKLNKNFGISENTNIALEMAIGDYFALVDHDDLLHRSAFYEMMCKIDQTNADFLYSDEVKFEKKVDNIIGTNFKPDFGKDELRSHNYICHLTVFSKELLGKIHERYRPEFDGSQDHDMVLRLTEKASHIEHIPKVLYYWRVHQSSVAGNLDSKSYAVDAAINAIKDQLSRCNEPGDVKSNLPYRTIYRIRYEIRETPLVTICIHNVTSKEDIKEIEKTIKTLTNYTKIEYKFVTADDEKISSKGKLWNNIIKYSKGKYFIFMDSNCIPLEKNWIEEMLMYSQRNDICSVGPKIIYSDDTICNAGVILDNESKSKVRFVCHKANNKEQGYEAMLRHVRNITAIWQGCFMIKKEIIESLGGFSEDIPGYEDIDISLRGRNRGLYNVWTCFSLLKYSGSHEFLEKNIVNAKIFENKWENQLKKRDPYGHPILKKMRLI